jgi:hypothetical protein
MPGNIPVTYWMSHYDDVEMQKRINDTDHSGKQKLVDQANDANIKKFNGREGHSKASRRPFVLDEGAPFRFEPIDYE